MKSRSCLMLMVVVLAGGCGKKQPGDADKPGAGSGSAASAATGSAASGTAGSAAVHTAEGSAVVALPIVNDCPKSLAGSEQVARTIKKECGPITVTAEYDVNGSLTLEAGVVLKIADGAELDVGYNGPAKLIVKGTDKEPVVMTSAGDPAPGAWKGLRLFEGAARSQLTGLVIENAGGDRGALYVNASDVTLEGSTIRNAKEIGLKVDQKGGFAKLAGNTFDKAGKIAITTVPAAVGGFGTNKLDDGAFVQVEAGRIEESAKWQNPGAPYVLIGEVGIDGKNGRATLEILAGTELRGKDAEIDVGYTAEATLIVSGTADKPVVFTAAEDKTPGAWHGIWVYDKGEARITGAAISYAGGGTADRGAVYLEGGSATITGTTFDHNKRGVHLTARATIKGFDQNKLSASPEPALALFADQVGSLGAGNTFDKDAHIELAGGKLTHSATWLPQSVAYEVTSELSVDDNATLTLAPGVDLAFAADQQLSVGYTSAGTLKAVGSKDKPIKLRPLRDDATWKGLWLYASSTGTELAGVQLAGTGGDAAVVVDRGASAKLSDLTCAKCAGAAVLSRCGATLTTKTIQATAGTPKAEIKPDCPK